MLAGHPSAKVVAEAAGVAAACACLDEHAPDLPFLDIELRGEDACALFQGGPVRAAVVFVTAHAEHALRAFECDVIDYLLKPVRPERLADALARAERWRASLTSPTGTPRRAPELCLWSRKGLLRVAYDDILHIVARDDHSELFLRDGTSHLDGARRDGWQQRLPRSFLRTHRSHIVNLGAVVGICRRDNGWTLQLRDGVPAASCAAGDERGFRPPRAAVSAPLVPISRGRVAAVRAALRAASATG